MDFNNKSTNTHDRYPWSDYSDINSFIPVTVEEISAENERLSDLGSVSSSDAYSTPASYHSDSSGFREAQPLELAAIQANFAGSDESTSPQSGTFNSELQLTTISGQINSFSVRPKVSSYHDSSCKQFDRSFQGETLVKVTDYNTFDETGFNFKRTGSIDDLIPTISEDCSIADLMDLPLDENILRQENDIHEESRTFFDERSASRVHSGSVGHQYHQPESLPTSELCPRKVSPLPGKIARANGYPDIHSEDGTATQKASLDNVSFQNYTSDACVLSIGASGPLSSVERSEVSCASPQNVLPIIFPEPQSINITQSNYSLQNSFSNDMMPMSDNQPVQFSQWPIDDFYRTEPPENKNLFHGTYFHSPVEKNIMRDGQHQGHGCNESLSGDGSEMTSCRTEVSYGSPDSDARMMQFRSISGSAELFDTSVSRVQGFNPQSSVANVKNNSESYELKQFLGNSVNVSSTNRDLTPASPVPSGPASKICEVCGDVAKSMHFGGMACDSCKAFFRRSVQGKYWKKFRCSESKSCKISKLNRRGCQFCRFEKCRKSGMKISWVMSDEERLELWKRRTKPHHDENDEEEHFFLENTDCNLRHKYLTNNYEDKLQKFENCHLKRKKKSYKCKSSDFKLRKESYTHPSPQLSLVVSLAGESKLVPDTSIRGTSIRTCSENHPLSRADLDALNHLIELQSIAFSRNCFSKSCAGNTVESSYNVYLSIVEKSKSFYRENEDYLSIAQADRTAICKEGSTAAVVLFPILYNFDKKTMSWPRDSCMEAIKIPYLTAETAEKLTKSSSRSLSFTNFCITYSPEVEDEGVLAILHLLALLHSADYSHKFENAALVTKYWEKYLHLLIRYLRFRQGERGYIVTLPKLLSAITDGKKLASEITLSFDTVMASNNLANKTGSQELGAAVQTLSPYSSVDFQTDINCTERHTSISGQVESHHPATIAMFGPRTQADILLPDPIEEIVKFGGKKLFSFEKKPRLTNLEKATKVSSCTSGKGMVWDNNEEQKNSTSRAVTVLGTGPYEQDSLLQSASKISWSEEKSAGIQVLCEMLQYVAHGNDPCAMESIRRFLPRELIEKLAGENLDRSNGENSNPV